MKQIFSLITLLIASLTHFNAQNIPNGDLETWIESPGAWSEIPDGWSTQNGQLFQSQFKETDACQGEYAMKLTPMAATESIMGTSTLKFPATAIPPALNFCVKTNIESDNFFTDTCRVIISFFNAGNEFYSEEWVNTESISDWTLVSIPLTQIEPLMDSCHIEVQASYPGIGLGSGSLETWITVDDFSFEGTNAVPDHSTTDVSIFPNPSSDGVFTISSSAPIGEFKLLDLLGNVVLKERQIGEKQLAVTTDLPIGLYFLQWNGVTRKIILE